jgi:hypothetical protein
VARHRRPSGQRAQLGRAHGARSDAELPSAAQPEPALGLREPAFQLPGRPEPAFELPGRPEPTFELPGRPEPTVELPGQSGPAAERLAPRVWPARLLPVAQPARSLPVPPRTP